MRSLSILVLIVFSITLALAQSEEILLQDIEDTGYVEVLAEVDKVYNQVDHMPMFPGCKLIKNYDDRLKCAENKLIRYVSKKLKYPKVARKNKISGMVYVQFVVNKDGSLSDINVVRDIGHGCGQALADVIESMNKKHRWSPGLKEGKPVRVLFTLPVDFKF